MRYVRTSSSVLIITSFAEAEGVLFPSTLLRARRGYPISSSIGCPSAILQLSDQLSSAIPGQLDSAIFRYIPGHVTIRRAGFKVVSGEAEAAELAAASLLCSPGLLAWRAALPGEVYVKADDTKRSFKWITSEILRG